MQDLFQCKMSLKGRAGVAILKIGDRGAPKRIRRFIVASEGVRFESENYQQRYNWVEQVLESQQFA